MQIDMHYYATYAIARAAGILPKAARTIAFSAQFVDDNIAESSVDFKDGGRIDQEPTAHHFLALSNHDGRDQRRVWVPFHFIPGNEGDSYTERLKCRMDSRIAQEMCDHHLTLSKSEFALQLLGIAAHVYADTFSHYGFSGVSSRGNKVDNASFRFHEDVEDTDNNVMELKKEMREYVTKKANQFFESRGPYGGLFTNIKSWSIEKASGALGHGSVATYPDRPYLVWRFDYEREDAVDGNRSTRNNPETYLKCCRALHEMFTRFAKKREDLCCHGGHRKFDSIEHEVRKVLEVQANKRGRIEAWKRAAREDKIFGTGNEDIPEYDSATWNSQWETLNGGEDSRAAIDQPVWLFYQAASLHRTYVLRDLLPNHRLIVD